MKIAKALFILAAVAVLAPGSVRAQSQVFTKISSATSCHITVSTFAATRVDNYNGTTGCDGLMTGRTVIKIINGSGILHGGYSSRLSTQTASVNLGETWNPNDKQELEIDSGVPYYMMSETAASAPNIIVQQAKSQRQYGE